MTAPEDTSDPMGTCDSPEGGATPHARSWCCENWRPSPAPAASAPPPRPEDRFQRAFAGAAPGTHEIRPGVPFWVAEFPGTPPHYFAKTPSVHGVPADIHLALTFGTREQCEAWIEAKGVTGVVAREHLVTPAAPPRPEESALPEEIGAAIARFRNAVARDDSGETACARHALEDAIRRALSAPPETSESERSKLIHRGVEAAARLLSAKGIDCRGLLSLSPETEAEIAETLAAAPPETLRLREALAEIRDVANAAHSTFKADSPVAAVAFMTIRDGAGAALGEDEKGGER